MSTHSISSARWHGSEDGRIYAPDFGDVYASRAGAWGQAEAVFIDGCGLLARWQHPTCIRVLETGFGLGVNFLASWASLRASGGPARLHYVSVDKHPFSREDLAAALELSLATVNAPFADALRPLAERLLQAWPPLLPGFHAIELDDAVSLTLVFGDVIDVLPQVAGCFDAIYLDGFAPDRNPAMWSPAVMRQIAALAAPGARVSSWCVAGAVRRALAEAGFHVSKRPGFGGKRDSLSAVWPVMREGNDRVVDHGVMRPSGSAASMAVVIGAGIAGASVARQLARRGIEVMVLERETPAAGGSGNPVGVVRPEPGGDTNPITELSAAGVTWLRRWISRHGPQIPHDWCGVLRIARDERKRDKIARQAATAGSDWLEAVSLADGERLCGVATAEAGFHLPQAGWVVPPALVAAMLAHPAIKVRGGAEVVRIDRQGQGWQLILADGSAISSPVVVLATAFDAGLGPLRLALGRARGQLSCLPARDDRPLRKIVCRDGYITPAVDGHHTIGATVQHDDEDPSARRTDDAQNFDRLQRLLPAFATDVSALRSGRVGWRATTPDRVPLVGKLEEGLYASLGHGARGITCAPLCGEMLAALICDEPLPLARTWLARLDPLRRVSGD